jgi:hypothetical protein
LPARQPHSNQRRPTEVLGLRFRLFERQLLRSVRKPSLLVRLTEPEVTPNFQPRFWSDARNASEIVGARERPARDSMVNDASRNSRSDAWHGGDLS